MTRAFSLDQILQVLLLRVLVRKEGEAWVAQCLDHDIAAQGRTVDEVMSRFERTLTAQAEADLRRKRALFEGIPPAPEEYFRAFEQTRFRETRTIRLPAEITSPQAIQQEFRLAA